METKTIYQVRAEATSPSGVQLEWTLYGFNDYRTAQQRVDSLTVNDPTETIGGVEWDVNWVVVGTEVNAEDYNG